MTKFCLRIRWILGDFTRWVRHSRMNPVPCTCYDCEIKKPLPEWAIRLINEKLENGTIPRRKVKRNPEDKC